MSRQSRLLRPPELDGRFLRRLVIPGGIARTLSGLTGELMMLAFRFGGAAALHFAIDIRTSHSADETAVSHALAAVQVVKEDIGG